LPEGYEFVSGKAKMQMLYYLPSGSYNTVYSKTITADYWDETHIVLDQKKFYDLNYNGSDVLTTGGYLSNGLLRPGNERYRALLTCDIRATRGAPFTVVRPVYETMQYKDLRDGEIFTFTATPTGQTWSNTNNTPMQTGPSSGSNTTLSKSFTYTGLATVITLSVNNIKTQYTELEIPVVSVGNPNPVSINNTYLYVEGDVNNIKLDGVAGVGYQGRWLKVADEITSGTYAQPRLTFSYSGSKCLDSIRIFVVSGYNTTWTPVTGSNKLGQSPAIDYPLDRTDYDHEGAKKWCGITVIPAAVDGQISVTNVNSSIPNGTIVYDETQELSVEINSFGATGSVRGTVTVSVPDGQLYQAGTATIEYPIGTIPMTVANSYENYLLNTENINVDGTGRTFDFSLGLTKDNPTLSINGVGDDNDRRAILRLKFKPNCNTSATGMRYTGTLSGENVCGQSALGTGKLLFSDYQYPKSASGYDYNSTPAFNGNSVVSQSDTIVFMDFTFTKTSGPAISINATDSLVLVMNSAFDVLEANFPVGGYGAMANPTIVRQYIQGTDRYVIMTTPVAYLNSLSGYGIDVDIIYNLKISYNPTLYNIANGVKQDVMAYIKTTQQFGGPCSAVETAIGASTASIGIVVFDPFNHTYCPDIEGTATIENAALYGYTDFLFNWYEEANTASTLITAGAVGVFNTGHKFQDTMYVQVTNNMPPYDELGFVTYSWKTYPITEANFGMAMACVNIPLTFYDSTKYDGIVRNYGKIATWEWTAQNATVTTSSLQDPEFTFTTPGTYPVRLVVITIEGCTDTITKNVIVRENGYTITCPSNIEATLLEGMCDTMLNIGLATIIPAAYDNDVVISNTAVLPFKRGFYPIEWTVADTYCSLTPIDQCTQVVVVNTTPCGINDTTWALNGAVTVHPMIMTPADGDGNTYETVRLACHCWTKSNITSTTYVGGDPANYTIYNSSQFPNTSANTTEFGYLYNYAAATKGATTAKPQGICPTGWHIPEQKAWTGLQEYGSKELKATGTNYWLGEANITNSTQFTAKPAGYYNGIANAHFEILGDAWFWISEPNTVSIGKACHLFFGCPELFITNQATINGLSVRCIRD
jgi:uncharacterized protein (TIGR02145 family)